MSQHPSYSKVQGFDFDFSGLYSERIFRKMGDKGFKLIAAKESAPGSKVFIGTYSNGALPVVLKDGVPLDNPDRVYYTQRYEVDSKGRFIMQLRVGPNPAEAKNLVWSDTLVFRMAGNKSSLERRDPVGNISKGSYSSIQSGKSAGLDFGGIEPERLYRKVEQAARKVLTEYFDSVDELVSNLTRESVGNTLNASTYAQHGLDFNHKNFYTRVFRYFGRLPIAKYDKKVQEGTAVYSKRNSVGVFPVYKGSEERWSVNQVFRLQDGGFLKATNLLTNFSTKEDMASVKKPVRMWLSMQQVGADSWSITSTLRLGDKLVYSDTLKGTAEEVLDSAMSSRKLAWKYLDMPIKRSLGLMHTGITQFLSNVGAEENAEAEAIKENKTANKVRVSLVGSIPPEVEAFFDKGVPGSEVTFGVAEDEKGDWDVTYKVTPRGGLSIQTTVPPSNFGMQKPVSLRATLGSKLTLTVNYEGESFSTAKAIKVNELVNPASVQIFYDSVQNELLQKITSSHVGKQINIHSVCALFSYVVIGQLFIQYLYDKAEWVRNF